MADGHGSGASVGSGRNGVAAAGMAPRAAASRRPRGHQLAVREPNVRPRSLPGARFALLRVTGTKIPKTRWRFSRRGEDWFCFAGLIGRGPGDADAFALLTTDAGPDVVPIRNRQPVVLGREPGRDGWTARHRQQPYWSPRRQARSTSSRRLELRPAARADPPSPLG